jgi:23S rRNA pseudouridine1911/1915/1917 synthase
VRLILETGRTHQIRVHMAHIHYPVVGDQTYGGRMYLPKGCSEALRSFLKGFKRQALHAARLELHHPMSGKLLQFSAQIPDDMQELLRLLREDKPK